jgi:hypothetical protein
VRRPLLRMFLYRRPVSIPVDRHRARRQVQARLDALLADQRPPQATCPRSGIVAPVVVEKAAGMTAIDDPGRAYRRALIRGCSRWPRTRQACLTASRVSAGAFGMTGVVAAMRE